MPSELLVISTASKRSYKNDEANQSFAMRNFMRENPEKYYLAGTEIT